MDYIDARVLAAILLNPRKLLTAPAARDAAAYAPQFLIIATSDSGEPINVNLPGMYNDPKFVHPTDPTMAATPLTLGGTATVAAKPWSTLPTSTLARSCFFHHSTCAFQHGSMASINALSGAMRGGTMLVSAVGAALQPT